MCKILTIGNHNCVLNTQTTPKSVSETLDDTIKTYNITDPRDIIRSPDVSSCYIRDKELVIAIVDEHTDTGKDYVSNLNF